MGESEVSDVSVSGGCGIEDKDKIDEEGREGDPRLLDDR